jgi:hypothetical protein
VNALTGIAPVLLGHHPADAMLMKVIHRFQQIMGIMNCPGMGHHMWRKEQGLEGF